MKYRLALDAGTTSLGWSVFELGKDLEPVRLIDIGVRIFSDGRDDKKEPLAVSRRNARSIRRNRDRTLIRQKRLMNILIDLGLMPASKTEQKNLEGLNPYELRVKALNEKIPLYHLGRVLFHISQRRGFKSNRKTDKRENDMGAMKRAIEDLRLELDYKKCRTVGEYLYHRLESGQNTRIRPVIEKNKANYEFYPGREMIADELDLLLEKQRGFHPELTQDICKQIIKEILFQRPLKKPDVGYCRFENEEKRARLSYPEVQNFRIWQEVNNLDLEQFKEHDPRLDHNDREKLAHALMQKKKMTFGQMRSLLDIPKNMRFNLESDNRKELNGNDTNVLLSDEKCFGESWYEMDPDQQNALIDLLCDEPDHDELIFKLISDWNVNQTQAENIASAPLKDGYGRVSLKAIRKILPELQNGHGYAGACQRAAYHHSDDRTGEVFERLPYYGEILPESLIGGTFSEADRNRPEIYFGKINNPTVHIVLNQIRKLVNTCIHYYGHPEDIVIEMARDLKEPRADIIKEQTRNKKENDRINAELEELRVKQNYRNRMLFKLWEDLCPDDPVKRCCPLSGYQISKSDIFSGNFEEEHILPFSRSYNDGRGNKMLSHRDWNRKKGNKSPYEAFGHTDEWDLILARVNNMPKNKRWRFQPDAWEIAKGEGEDMIARMLNDTRYMVRMAKKYMSAVFNNEYGRNRVRAIPGQMTALLRDKWGLDNLLDDVWREELEALFPDKPQLVEMLIQEDDSRKNRMHHLHHAVDAFVTGCTTQGMLQNLSKAARQVEEKKELREKRKKLIMDMPQPFDGFREQVRDKLRQLVISYRPNHGGAKQAIARGKTVAPLHKQTAYGYKGEGKKKNTQIFTTRIALETIKKHKDIAQIADETIRNRIAQKLDGVKEGSSEWKQSIEECGRPGVIIKPGIRHLRINIEKSDGSMVGISSQQIGKPYKFYELRGNYCAEIWCPHKGKKAGQWQCEIIPNYYAHQADFIPHWKRENPTAKLIMRLHIDDMVRYEEDGRLITAKVKKMDVSGRVALRDNRIAVEQADKLSWAASAGQLQKKNGRKISVDILGRVLDPVLMKEKNAA